MSIFTAAAASALPSMPSSWKEFSSANQRPTNASNSRLNALLRDQPVENVIAYNGADVSYEWTGHENRSHSFDRRQRDSRRQGTKNFGVPENPLIPTKESPPNLSSQFVSIDVLA